MGDAAFQQSKFTLAGELLVEFVDGSFRYFLTTDLIENSAKSFYLWACPSLWLLNPFFFDKIGICINHPAHTVGKMV